MKSLKGHLNESLLVEAELNMKPKTNRELKDLVRRLIKERGNNADLNDIDTSLITDMSEVFYETKFNGDISKWNTSNVKDMFSMFALSDFNGDISKWDVRKVRDMSFMFHWSNFNGDISKWDVRNVRRFADMFRRSKFSGDISGWKVNSSKVRDMSDMFNGCPLEGNEPAWYKQ
jgi:surface protein